MKNKFIISCILAVAVIVGVGGYFYYGYSAKSFDDFLGMDEANITKVLMTNGNNGSSVETTDKDKIKEIITLVNDDRDYKKSFNQAPRTGYSYHYDFYSGDKQIVRITGSGDNVKVNGTYYDVSKSISNDSLKKWFNSLPVNH